VRASNTRKPNPLLIFSLLVDTSMKDDLTSIQGVGDKTADKIMTVFEEHYSTSDEVGENLETALEYYETGEYEYAGKFLRRAVDGL
jgi:Holliday junction resolvasome RuvABC DNA-binding subunit